LITPADASAHAHPSSVDESPETARASGEHAAESSPEEGTRRARVRVARRVGRYGVAVLLGLGAVALLYLVAMNLVLRTRILRDALTAESGTLRVEYASAYCAWPGIVHARGLVIRGRDSNVEWLVAVDHLEFHDSVLDLLRRRFRATHVRGDGVSVRLRQRLDRVTDAASALPPIPGFMDPPRAAAGPEPPPLTDKDYNLWTVELEDVMAEHVREIWVDTARIAGDLRVEGRWLFRPLRRLEVGPASVDLRSANVSYGGDVPLALDVHGSLVVTISPTDIHDTGGDFLARHATVDGDVRGAILPNALLEKLAGAGGARAVLSAWDIAPSPAHLVSDHATSTVVLDVPEVPLTSRAPLRALLPLPDGLDLEVARATLGVHAEVNLQARSGDGRVTFAAPDLRARTGDEVLAGPLELDLTMAARNSVVDFAGSSLLFRATVARDGAGADSKAKDERRDSWWVRVRAPEARLDLEHESPRFHARVSAAAKDASPVSAFLGKVTPLPRWLIDAVPTQNVELKGELRARPSAFEVRSLEATSNGSTVDFEFEKLAYWKEWAVLVQAGAVHAGVRSGDGGTEVVLFNAGPWFDAQTAAFRANAARVR
jgi:hypothetical protein